MKNRQKSEHIQVKIPISIGLMAEVQHYKINADEIVEAALAEAVKKVKKNQ